MSLSWLVVINFFTFSLILGSIVTGYSTDYQVQHETKLMHLTVVEHDLEGLTLSFSPNHAYHYCPCSKLHVHVFIGSLTTNQLH